MKHYGRRAVEARKGAQPGTVAQSHSSRQKVPLNVFPQIWQKWGLPSWCRLAMCLRRGPFSVNLWSQNSQLKGRSPVWVRLCLSRLAAGSKGRESCRSAAHWVPQFGHRHIVLRW